MPHSKQNHCYYVHHLGLYCPLCLRSLIANCSVAVVKVVIKETHTHTHTRLTALCPGLPGWAGTRKVKPIWILLKQETVSASGISWTIRKSAHRSRQIPMHRSVFYRPDALPAAQPTASMHRRQVVIKESYIYFRKTARAVC